MSIFDDYDDAWSHAGPTDEGCSIAFFSIAFGIFSALLIAAIIVDCILRGLNVDFQILEWFEAIMAELLS